MRTLWIATACVVCLCFGRPVYAQAYPRVSELDMNVDAYEPNPDSSHAPFLNSHNQWISKLSIYPAGDMDWYAWEPKWAGTLRVTVYENGNGPLMVVLLNKAGNILAWSSSTGSKEVLTYNATHY